MDILFLAFLGILLWIVVKKSHSTFQRKADLINQEIKRRAKRCPPHKWQWKNQPDSDAEYMICEFCKRTPSGDQL